ncbi:unnamed protein product, partial [marine sediment metagenome]
TTRANLARVMGRHLDHRPTSLFRFAGQQSKKHSP